MSEPGPAERYAAGARRTAATRITAAFAASQRFDLDPFQIAGCRALEEGRSVLVAAPTGAGKTIVGEFAVHLAMREPAERARRQGVLHDADQGAVEPEVPRAVRTSTARTRSACSPATRTSTATRGSSS